MCPPPRLLSVRRSIDWHKFKRLLASKTFAAHDTKRIRGEVLTAAWAGKGGFREPVIATDKTGMGLKVQTANSRSWAWTLVLVVFERPVALGGCFGRAR